MGLSYLLHPFQVRALKKSMNSLFLDYFHLAEQTSFPNCYPELEKFEANYEKIDQLFHEIGISPPPLPEKHHYLKKELDFLAYFDDRKNLGKMYSLEILCDYEKIKIYLKRQARQRVAEHFEKKKEQLELLLENRLELVRTHINKINEQLHQCCDSVYACNFELSLDLVEKFPEKNEIDELFLSHDAPWWERFWKNLCYHLKFFFSFFFPTSSSIEKKEKERHITSHFDTETPPLKLKSPTSIIPDPNEKASPSLKPRDLFG